MLAAFFIDYAFYFVFFLFVAWVYSVYIAFGQNLKALVLRDWRFFAFSVAAAGIVFLTVHVDYKILSDETNLLSVSRMLSSIQKAANNTAGLFYYETYKPIMLEMPTRPLLFPFLTAIVHLIAGESDRSPFILNFILTVLFFYSASLLAGESGKKSFRILSVLAIAASPVFSLHATSAGFDNCSLAFGLWSFLVFRSYIFDQENLKKLQCLAFTLLCFASVRYESVLVLPIFLAALLFLRGKNLWGELQASWLFISVPILSMPILVQRIATWGQFENAPGIPAFSAEGALSHFPTFLHSFFLPLSNEPYLFLFHCLGIVGIYLCRPRSHQAKVYFFTLAASLGILWILILAHHMGLAAHPTQVRLFMPFSVALVLLGVYAITEIPNQGFRNFFLGLAALQIVMGQSYAMRDPLITQLVLTRETHYLRTFLATQKNVLPPLIIYDRPGQMTAFGYGSVDFAYLLAHRADLLQNLHDGLYTKIYVLQHRSLRDKLVPADNRAPAELTLKELGFYEISESEAIVVCEVAN